MRYREMGKTATEVSVLGFGCMRFPVVEGNGDMIDEAKSIEMIRHAIDNGVNYLDTAFFYLQRTAFQKQGKTDNRRHQIPEKGFLKGGQIPCKPYK